MEKTSDIECRQNHAYYAQVQGKMGVSGVKWCYFAVYTNKGNYGDPVFCQNIRTELADYNFHIFLSLQRQIFNKKIEMQNILIL